MSNKILIIFVLIICSVGMALSNLISDTGLVNSFGFIMLATLIFWHKTHNTED